MCGLLLAHIASAVADAERTAATALAADSAWPVQPVVGLPTKADRVGWLACRDLFPDGMYDQAATLDYIDALELCEASLRGWWQMASAWWASGHFDAIRRLWSQLGALRYGRIVYNPRTGEGWWQGRPRKILFPHRLHPVGVQQWSQKTTPAESLALPQMIIEASPWPLRLCCCSFGVDPGDPDQGEAVRSLLVAVVDAVFGLVDAAPPDTYLVLEVDEDYGEVFY